MGMVTDTKKLGEDIITSYDSRVKALGELASDTHRMIGEFQADHKKMAENLRRSLEKGGVERIKDFKEMMGDVKKFVADTIEGTAKLIEEMRKEQKEMATTWQRISDTMRKKREGKISRIAKAAEEVIKSKGPKRSNKSL